MPHGESPGGVESDHDDSITRYTANTQAGKGITGADRNALLVTRHAIHNGDPWRPANSARQC